MYRRVERKGTKKKRERKKGGRGGEKKKKKEGIQQRFPAAVYAKESDVKMAAYVYWLFVFLNEFTRLNESSP